MVHSSRWLKRPELNQAVARSLEGRMGFPHVSQGPKHLDHLLQLSQVHYQGTRAEVEVPGLELVVRWNAA